MSGDDDDRFKFDYQQTFPTYSRNRKRRTATPRSKQPEFTAFKSPAKAVSKKIRWHSGESRRGARRRIDEHPLRSMAAVAREMIVQDVSLTVDELMAKLEALGYEAAPVTISAFRSDTRAILKIAQELNIDVQKLDFG